MLEYEQAIAFGVFYEKLLELSKGGRHRVDARRWVKSNTRTFSSFSWCCRRLGLSVDTQRTRLLGRKPGELQKIIKAFRIEKDREEEGVC